MEPKASHFPPLWPPPSYSKSLWLLTIDGALDSSQAAEPSDFFPVHPRRPSGSEDHPHGLPRMQSKTLWVPDPVGSLSFSLTSPSHTAVLCMFRSYSYLGTLVLSVALPGSLFPRVTASIIGLPPSDPHSAVLSSDVTSWIYPWKKRTQAILPHWINFHVCVNACWLVTTCHIIYVLVYL